MKIGIIGAGNVGQQLAADLSKLGHETVIGTRDTSKLAEFKEKNPQISIGSFAEAAAQPDLIMLATNWAGTQNALELAGIEQLKGKTVVDITNPLDFSSGKPALALGFNTSAGEMVQSWLPNAHVVKALNSITAFAMLNPKEFIGGEPDMFIAGNDSDAKKQVSSLLESVGWGIVDLGDITQSRLIEPLALIWITIGFQSNWTKVNHGFKLLNK
jgi:8-hydroxy-5-deazaflavin:NADPH oxidoreductase